MTERDTVLSFPSYPLGIDFAPFTCLRLFGQQISQCFVYLAEERLGVNSLLVFKRRNQRQIFVHDSRLHGGDGSLLQLLCKYSQLRDIVKFAALFEGTRPQKS